MSLQERFIQEMLALEEEGRTLTLHLDSTTAFTIIAHLQLALRHPGTKGKAPAITTNFINQIAKSFADQPACLEVIKKGFDPEYDIS